MNRILTCCLCLCVAQTLPMLQMAHAATVATDEGEALHLIEVLEMALASNPLLGSEASKLHSLRAGISEAKAGWLPKVTANYDQSQSNSSYIYQTGVTRNDDDPSTVQSIVIRQPLWDWGKTKAEVESARARYRAGESTLSLVEGQVLMEALDAFFDVQRDRQVMGAAEESAQVMQQQVEATEKRLEAGATILTDEARVRARLYAAEGKRAEAQGALANSLAAFERATSIANPGTLTGIVPDNVDRLTDIAADEWGEHPSVIAAKASERSAYQAFKSEQRSIWPDLSLTGQVRKLENTGSSYVSELEESSFGFKFDAPIYQGGAQFARARKARALWESAQFGVQDSERKAREGAISAARTYRYSNERLRAAIEQVQASERAFLLMKEEVAAARKSLVDQLDAQNELLEARTNLAHATRDAHMAAWSVLFALGRLDAEWLEGMQGHLLP
ncbi:MAG: TolC family outer membrane protein [Gammaproteobacteria bacterium]|nr:TolC family outer membrane protein [Gammaproteobacteria bacterium]MCY4278992.1 TolC family outer membrane protein [Gammaproteobacteria bacterium]